MTTNQPQVQIPLTEPAFDNLLVGVFHLGRSIQSLSDDELLVLAEVGELTATGKGAALAAQVDGWATTMQAVQAEIESR